MKLLPLSTLAACLALAAAGCGSSDDNGGGSSSSSSEAAPASSGSSGGGTQIDMKNIQFNPKQQTVKVGDKVTWTNQDDVDHNVVATGGPAKFESDNFGKGDTYTFTPNQAGTIKYTCTLHPGMDGVLNVTQ